MALTIRETIFAYAYVKMLDETAAKKEAGMTPDARPLDRKAVMELVGKLVSQRAARLSIDADRVVLELLHNAQAARLSKHYRDSNDALRMIGEHFMMWPDRKGTGPLVHQPVLTFGRNANDPAKALNAPEPADDDEE